MLTPPPLVLLPLRTHRCGGYTTSPDLSGALLHQSTAASTWWCSPRPRLGWAEMAVGLPESLSYPGHSPTFFRYAAP